MKSAISIVIPSCPAYEDVLAVSLALLKAHWTDCPWPLSVFTQGGLAYHKEDGLTHYHALPGGDQGWCKNLARALDLVPVPVVMLWLDDFLMPEPPNTKLLADCAAFMLAHREVKCLRVYGSPGPDFPYGPLSHAGVIDRHADYRVSTAPAFWDREYLMYLAYAVNASAWEFETEGTKVAHGDTAIFLSLDRETWPINFVNGLLRGRWTTTGLVLCDRLGIDVSESLTRRGRTA